jgi:HAD superfamily hydrolase (TIGR01509 family)
LAGEYQLGIISNAFPDVQYNKLKGIGILDYFHTIVLSEECGIRKPDERIFHQAAQALGCAEQECLYVGNSFDVDVVGAMNAGMKACWFNADGNKVREGDMHPDYEIAQLSELLEILL